MSKVVAITGANRGIGLALVKQFLKDEDTRVIAGVRQPEKASELKELGSRVDVTTLDVSDPISIEAWVKTLKEKYAHIDVMVNNAGTAGTWPAFGTATKEEFVDVYSVNAFGPFLVTQSLFNEGLIGGEVATLNVIISSLGGSMTSLPQLMEFFKVQFNAPVSPFIYLSSKSAVNMLVNTLTFDLKDKGITTVAIHPGSVETGMNRFPGIKPEESAERVLNILNSGKELQGKFYSDDGSILPW